MIGMVKGGGLKPEIFLRLVDVGDGDGVGDGDCDGVGDGVCGGDEVECPRRLSVLVTTLPDHTKEMA